MLSAHLFLLNVVFAPLPYPPLQNYRDSFSHLGLTSRRVKFESVSASLCEQVCTCVLTYTHTHREERHFQTPAEVSTEPALESPRATTTEPTCHNH